MNGVLDLWTHQPLWFWWALGAVLIAVEVASTTTYLLWPGIAAFLVGLAVLAFPALDGRFAIFLFAVLAVAATWAWKRWFPSMGPNLSPADTLNRRAAQYLGRSAIAEEDFSGDRGAVLIDDTRWSAVAIDGSHPRKADPLTIAGANGTTLEVRLAR